MLNSDRQKTTIWEWHSLVDYRNLPGNVSHYPKSLNFLRKYHILNSFDCLTWLCFAELNSWYAVLLECLSKLHPSSTETWFTIIIDGLYITSSFKGHSTTFRFPFHATVWRHYWLIDWWISLSVGNFRSGPQIGWWILWHQTLVCLVRFESSPYEYWIPLDQVNINLPHFSLIVFLFWYQLF